MGQAWPAAPSLCSRGQHFHCPCYFPCMGALGGKTMELCTDECAIASGNQYLAAPCQWLREVTHKSWWTLGGGEHWSQLIHCQVTRENCWVHQWAICRILLLHCPVLLIVISYIGYISVQCVLCYDPLKFMVEPTQLLVFPGVILLLFPLQSFLCTSC